MSDMLSKEEVDLLKKIILSKDTEIQRSIDILTKEHIEQIKADLLKIHKELINALKDFSVEYTNLADKLESFYSATKETINDNKDKKEVEDNVQI